MPILMLLDAFLIVVGVCYFCYQIFLMIVSLVKKPVIFPDADPSSLAILICARNEEEVIGTIINSIHEQIYDHSQLDIWVIADNCTDNTAKLSRSLGAHVLERQDTEHIGKSFLMEFFLNHLRSTGLIEKYQAYIVMDSDNTMDPNFVREMNNAFRSGYNAVIGFRNSRNLNQNWVASGSSLWFIRESRMFSGAKMKLGITSHIGGTGYLISREIFEDHRNWIYHTITEDLELTMSVILRGEIVAYNAKAIYYDEQPISFRQSLRQRVRWMKGTLQVSRYYGLEMFKQSIRQKRISMLDMGMFIFPWIILIVVRIFIGCAFCFLGFVSWESQISAFGLVLFGYIQGLLMVSIMTVAAVLVERKSLNATKRQLVLYLLLFPIYCVAYFPTALVALFSKPQWKPIYHGQSNRLDQKQPLKTQESRRD